ncbi:MAG TPA: LysE family translocator [Xanthobacteraceae bacterium]|jgi:threonine/homoserine/homoserine lactone efflux protein|nr:LysE family translocator [Xanthobacteraceae bacterium]
MNWELFAAFLVITVVLIVTPGPIVTLVIATGVSQGIRAALITVAGTSAGNALLLGVIAFGLSWVLHNAAVLFELLRWAGAAYLVWLGIQAWRHAGAVAAVRPGTVNFSRGFAVALTNPKTIAFFTAFLPQFVDPHLPAARQLVVMCAVTVVLAALSDSLWAISAGLGRGWFLNPVRAKILGRLSGAVLIGGGVWLSLVRRAA